MRNGIRFRGLLLFIAVSFLGGQSLFSQETEELRPAGEGVEAENQSPQQRMIEEAMKRSLDQLKKGYELQMAVRISEMKEACKLDEKQVQKLRMAAKGSIVKALEAQKESMEEMQSMFADGEMIAIDNVVAGVDLNAENVAEPAESVAKPDGDIAGPDTDRKVDPPAKEEAIVEDKPANGDIPIEVEVAVEAAEEMIDVAAVQGMPAMGAAWDFAMPFVGGQREEHSPWYQPLWRETVAGTLSSDQAKLLEAMEKERADRTRRIQIRNFVQHLDGQLRLNSKQFEEMEAFVDKEYGDKLEMVDSLFMYDSGMMDGFDINLSVAGAGGNPDDAKPTTPEALRKILSAEQLAVWDMEFAPKFQMMEMQNAMPVGVGGAIFRALGGALQIQEPIPE